MIKDTLFMDVLRIINGDEGMQAWNNMVISLISKIRDPKIMIDFRPISLCNISYKILAWAITNRFCNVLAQIVDSCQSAFVLGRLITK